MCGLLGFLNAQLNHDDATHVLENMAQKLVHRGPDAQGVWFDEQDQIGLGHRRLSILDISPAGHQPMISSTGRYVIAFNGEIYNHLELRKLIGGANDWRGHSDTETLLAGFDIWGIQATIERATGMFAFAVWDKEDRVLTLGRDRLGEKPLYYGWQQGCFLFASELKALQVHPAFNADVDRNALALMMRHNTIPAPYCIWQGMHKLVPGSLLQVSLSNPEPKIVTYWSHKAMVESGQCNLYQGTFDEAVLTLEQKLLNVIKQQMVADVPVGAFLSGGVDSSLIVALMQAQSDKPIHTFSIGFNEEQYNEAHHAKRVADHLGTLHTELYVRPEDALGVITLLSEIYDEPFADSSQIVTYLVSQLAKRQVTVCLSGDGGDELFGGYSRYLKINQIWSMFSQYPIQLRRIASKMIQKVSPARWDKLIFPCAQFMPNKLGMLYPRPGEKLHKGASLLSIESMTQFYRGLVSHWEEPTRLVLGSKEPQTVFTNEMSHPMVATDIERMMSLDLMTYLPDDILAKVDRAAMAVSLETRVPFLDHNMVEFAWSLPLSYKVDPGVGKRVLREVLYKYVPQTLIDRPKMGFGLPLDLWLRGPMREWADDLLCEQRLINDAFFNVSMVRTKWHEHLNGRKNWAYLLWDVLVFQQWLAANKGT